MAEVKIERLLNRKDAAKLLGISLATLDRELARRRLPHVRIGRRVLFTDELLREYVQAHARDVLIGR